MSTTHTTKFEAALQSLNERATDAEHFADMVAELTNSLCAKDQSVGALWCDWLRDRLTAGAAA